MRFFNKQQLIEWFDIAASFVPEEVRNRVRVRWLYRKHYKENEANRRATRLLILDVLVKASGVILLPVYTNLMSPQAFGLYGILLSLCITLTSFSLFGMNVIHAKLYYDCKDEKERGQLNFTIYLFIFLLDLFFLGIFFFSGFGPWFSIHFFNSSIDINAYRWSLFITVFCITAYTILNNYLITTKNVRGMQIYNLLKLILIQGVVVWILFWGYFEAIFTRLMVASALELGLIFVIGLIYIIPTIYYKIHSIFLIKAIKMALPITVLNIVGFVIVSNQFLLEKYWGLEAAAIYNLSFLIGHLLMYFMNSFYNASLPEFLSKKDHWENFLHTKRTIKRIIILSILGIVGLVAMTQVCVWLGFIQKVYQPTVFVLPFIGFHFIAMGISALIGRHLFSYDRVDLAMWVGILIYLGVGCLNWLLIPNWSYFGAGFAICFPYLIGYYILYKLVENESKKHKS